MILITGGAGYIGSHCALSLIEKGFKVVIFDNLSTGHIETINQLRNYGDIEFIQGDLKNQSDINNVFDRFKEQDFEYENAQYLSYENVDHFY